MYVMKDGQPVTDDTNKYAFIILLLTMAFAEAVIAFVSAMICLCFKPDHEQRVSTIACFSLTLAYSH